MTAQPGQILDGKYRLLRVIGEGGMGVVWEGENVRIRRRVAVKILRASVTSLSESVERFEREAQAAARIGSAHIVEVFDLGDLPDGSRYLVMEHLEGEGLDQRLRAGPMSPQAAARVILQALEGLGRAHEAGIVHRDLKPENVFLARGRDGDHVKILDFGVSKFADAAARDHALTKTGTLLGTPAYMAPEQMRGAAHIDHRADLYSVGTILFECVSGQHPFEYESTSDLMFKVGLETARDVRQVARHIDDEFAEILRRALAREPDERTQSAYELYRMLGSWLERHPEGAASIDDDETRHLPAPAAAAQSQLASTAYAPLHVSPAAMRTVLVAEAPSIAPPVAPPTPARVMVGVGEDPVSAMASTPRADDPPLFPYDETLGSGASQRGSVALKAVIAAAAVLSVGGVALLLALHARGGEPASPLAVSASSVAEPVAPPPDSGPQAAASAPPPASAAPPAPSASAALPVPAAPAPHLPAHPPAPRATARNVESTPGGRVFRKDL
ncbi:MAG: serine/threonine protein kinase [Polyangiaceae bacterium]|nr:serine/threonine protein kinase [Polyangiaceae bacterium]